METYQAGDVRVCNLVTLYAVDTEGDAVETIEAEDLIVTWSVEGATVTTGSVEVRKPGVGGMEYYVPEGVVEPLLLEMRMCAAVLSYSWRPVMIHSALGSLLVRYLLIAPPHSFSNFGSGCPAASVRKICCTGEDGMA